MPITTLDFDTATALSREAEDALIAIADKHGLMVEVPPGRYDSKSFSFKVTLSVKTESGAPADFARKAILLMLPPDCYGQEFTSGGTVYRITGINLRRRKYPVAATTAEGKAYKFTASTVRDSLARVSA